MVGETLLRKQTAPPCHWHARAFGNRRNDPRTSVPRVLSLAMEGTIMGDQSRGAASDSVLPVEPIGPGTVDPASLLVTYETNRHPLECQSHSQLSIHRTVNEARRRIVEALWNAPTLCLSRRAMKMGFCCVSPMLFVERGQRPVCVAGYCRDRLCPTCMSMRSQRVRARLVSLVCSMNAPRFLTLTTRDDARPLSERLKEITDAVRRLRKVKAWKQHVRGGVMVWEVTYNAAKKTWHPHVHLIIDGEYWEQRLIRAEWCAQLNGDGGVHIQACNDRVKTARYVAKYLAKASEISTWPPEAIREFATAMYRQRLVATFGRSHAVNVDLAGKESAAPALPRYSISMETFRAALRDGVGPARYAAPVLARMGGCWSALFHAYADPEESAGPEPTGSELDELGDWLATLADLTAPPTVTVDRRGPPSSDARLFTDNVYR